MPPFRGPRARGRRRRDGDRRRDRAAEATPSDAHARGRALLFPTFPGRGRAPLNDSSRPCAGDRLTSSFGRGQDPLTRMDFAGWSRDGSRGSPRPSIAVPARSSSRPAASTRHAGCRFRCRWAWPSWPGRRASCPPARPLRPPMITGGARGPARTGGGSLRSRFRVLSPPPPSGERGELRRKVSPPRRPAAGPSGPLGQARGPSPARPSWRDAAGIPAGRTSSAYVQIDNVSIPHAGDAKNPQKTRVFRGFRLEAIGRIVVYWCSVRGHRGPEMKVARAGAATPARAGSAS